MGRLKLSEIHHYLVVLFAQLLAIFSAGPFLIDRLCTWYVPSIRKKLDAWPHRREFFVWIMLAGVFVAGYLAWKEEYMLRLKAETITSDRIALDSRKNKVQIALRQFFDTVDSRINRQMDGGGRLVVRMEANSLTALRKILADFDPDAPITIGGVGPPIMDSLINNGSLGPSSAVHEQHAVEINTGLTCCH